MCRLSESNRTKTAFMAVPLRVDARQPGSLDGALGETSDDEALADQQQDERRQDRQRRGGGHLRVTDLVVLRELGDRDRHGGGLLHGEVERYSELVPAEDEGQDGAGGEARRDH